MKTSGFARFAGAIFIFVQREMTCSAVMRTTRAHDDKFSMFSCYLQSILTLNNWEIIAKTRRFTIFSMSSTSSLLKLRNISDWFVEFMHVGDLFRCHWQFGSSWCSCDSNKSVALSKKQRWNFRPTWLKNWNFSAIIKTWTIDAN